MKAGPLKVQLATARGRGGVVGATIIAEAAEIEQVFTPRAAAQFAAFLVEALGRLADPPPADDSE